MMAGFWSEVMEARRKGHRVLQLLRDNCQLWILHLMTIPFRDEGGIETPSDESKISTAYLSPADLS